MIFPPQSRSPCPRPRRGQLVPGVLLVALLPLAACGSLDIEARPLVSTYPISLFDRRETSVFTPIFDHSTEPLRTEWAIHPVFRRVRDEKKLEVQVLSPIFDYVGRPRRSNWKIFPLVFYENVERPQGNDWDLAAFPILYMGGGDAGEGYFGLFPIGGYLRNFASYDSVTFVLWPLYYSVTKRVTEERTNYNITPLFGWTSGGVLEDSYHIYPFYGQSVWKGKYDKRTYLFPFFHYDRYNLDTDHPATVVGFWPLFMHDYADNHEFWTWLWPFFRFNWEEPDRIGGLRNTEGERHVLYDFLWPIVHYESDRKKELFRIFPFYSGYHSDQIDREIYLIPLFWSESERVRDGVKDSFMFVPFFHHSVTSYSDERGDDSYFKLWPLYHYRGFSDGRVDLGIISPLPVMIEWWLNTLDENWGVFWSLYRFRRDERGAESYSALLGLIHGYRDGFERRFALGPLYTYYENTEQGVEHRILLGLLRFGSSPNGFTFGLGPFDIIG